MSGIAEVIFTDPKAALAAGHQAIELIKTLRARQERDPSINAVLMEIEKGCHETSIEFRNRIREFKIYCEQNNLDTSKTLEDCYRDQSWLRPDRKISLKIQSRRMSEITLQFGQFVEDAVAILNCFHDGSSAEGGALSTAVMRRKDVEAIVNIDKPIGELIDSLITFADELHSEFHAA